MFASPIRPRTMTKEWQEASEEYLKVRHYNAAVAARFQLRYTCLHIIVSRIRAHYWLQGHVGPVQVREGPPYWPEAQRRVKDFITSITASTTNQYRYLFSLGQHLLGTVCVQLTRRLGGPRYVILVLSVQKLEAFCAFRPSTTPSSICVRIAHCTRNAAQCTRT